ncbi:sulfur carrier protein ThiS [bacterium]|nr:sulfur carrier protein ThiS [bacterium]
MEIKVNGEPRQIEQETSVLKFIQSLGLDSRKVAVEHNGEILEETEFSGKTIKEGDSLEIVRFVGGG